MIASFEQAWGALRAKISGSSVCTAAMAYHTAGRAGDFARDAVLMLRQALRMADMVRVAQFGLTLT